ncbi:unnamed protein product, partial [Mycena citricolor]
RPRCPRWGPSSASRKDTTSGDSNASPCSLFRYTKVLALCDVCAHLVANDTSLDSKVLRTRMHAHAGRVRSHGGWPADAAYPETWPALATSAIYSPYLRICSHPPTRTVVFNFSCCQVLIRVQLFSGA